MQKTNININEKRIVSIILALTMFVAVFFCAPNDMDVAYGDEGSSELNYDYVALGDSVIFGTALKNPKKDGCFTLLTADLATVTGEPVSSENLAVKGWDTGNILDTLTNDEAIKAKLSHAKYITLNVGGNNLLGAVFDALKDRYDISPWETVQDYFSGHPFEALGLFNLTLDDFNGEQQKLIHQGEECFADEFPKIITLIKQYAPDAKLAVSTIYNPFSSLFAIQDDADEIITHMNDVINDSCVIEPGDKAANYAIADVYTSFKESEVKVVNAQLKPIDFFHPNVAGHRNIASEYLCALTGHINLDNVTIVGDKDVITYEYIASKPNNTMAFTVAVAAALGADKTVNWSLPAAQDIATVNPKTGLVTFTGKEGTITLTATSVQDPGKSDSRIITVIRKEEPTQQTPNPQEPARQDPVVNIPAIKNITKIRTTFTTINITKGKKLMLPIELDEGKLTVTKGAGMSFKSSDKKIVSVDKTGRIKGIKVGKAMITVTAENGKTLVIKVNVVKKTVKLKKFSLSGAPKKEILKIGTTAQLKIILAQKTATNLEVTYKSSKPEVISVDDAGKLTALKKGKATISVKIGAKTVKTKIITAK
jgi:lysophospholipase L1-like esterase